MSTPIRSAGLADLSRAVAVVHPHRMKSADQVDLNTVDPVLLLAAGDESGRASFFEFDENRPPLSTDHGTALLTLDRRARLHDYRDLDHKRAHRAMITVPPKVRENIIKLCGAGCEDEVLLTTLLVALADYAVLELQRQGRRLHVLPAPDDRAEERRQVRQQIANQAGSRS